MQESKEDLIILRCDACGNTFTAHEGDELRCELCGSTDAHPTHEPLL